MTPATVSNALLSNAADGLRFENVLQRRALRACIIVYVVSYIFMCKHVMALFNCEKVENLNLLVIDMRLDCNSPEYRMLLLPAFAGLVFYVFGVYVVFALVACQVNGRQTEVCGAPPLVGTRCAPPLPTRCPHAAPPPLAPCIHWPLASTGPLHPLAPCIHWPLACLLYAGSSTGPLHPLAPCIHWPLASTGPLHASCMPAPPLTRLLTPCLWRLPPFYTRLISSHTLCSSRSA
jgi:hypothetical protein